MASIFTIGFQNLRAQSPTDTTHKKQVLGSIASNDSLQVKPVKKVKSRLEAGISYLNNDVYLGRKDSSVLPYFIPSLSYYHKSGLYFSASLNYLKNAEASRVDLVTLEGGYIFSAGKYDGQLNVSRLFYNSQSTTVSSEIKASAEFQNGFDFGLIKTTLNLGLEFGTKTDYSVNFGLEHGFTSFHEKLEFTPTICVNTGTQNFYDNYYKNKRYSNRKNGRGVGNGNGGTSVIGSVVNPSNFKILDYEASVPLSYTIKKLVINFTPTYAIPVNPSLIDVQTSQSGGGTSNNTVTEHLTNSFYVSVGFTYKFE
jgi:hypothetical protein